jgi:hypothetical protein
VRAILAASEHTGDTNGRETTLIAPFRSPFAVA